MDNITISILIPTYNEEKNIIDKLNDINAINFPKDKMEIVIIDCSSDNTIPLIQTWFDNHLTIKFFLHHDAERMDVKFAMKKGISLASGEIIVRTDADSTLNSECLNHLVSTLKDKKIGCVTGKPSPLGSIEETSYRDINTKIQLLESKIDSTIIAHGPFTAFRKNIPFILDEGFGAEDSGTSVKIRKLGYKVILNPNIIFYEEISPDKREEQKIRRATGLIAMLWKNKDVLFNPKYSWYGFLIYPFNFSTTIIIPILLSPILIPLILLNIKGGTIIETFQILLKAIYRLLFTDKATMYWSK